MEGNQNSFLEFLNLLLFFTVIFLYLLRIIPFIVIIALATSFTALYHFELLSILEDFSRLGILSYKEILQSLVQSCLAAFVVLCIMGGFLLFANLMQHNYNLNKSEDKTFRQISNAFKLFVSILLVNSYYFINSCIDILRLCKNFDGDKITNLDEFILPFFKHAFEIAFILIAPQYLLLFISLISILALKKIAPKIYEQQYLNAVIMQVVLLGITLSLSVFNQQIDEFYNSYLQVSFSQIENIK